MDCGSVHLDLKGDLVLLLSLSPGTCGEVIEMLRRILQVKADKLERTVAEKLRYTHTFACESPKFSGS